jgi:ParB family chromosome partitioning protein
MVSRLQALTADLTSRAVPKREESPIDSGGTKFPPVAVGGTTPTRAKTAPGQMLAFRNQMLESDGEIEKLRRQLEAFDGSVPAVKLDARSVHRSKWANRDAASFRTSEFASLKSEIESAGGNVQPILVRPLAGRAGQYEVVFGHRRLQACLELGLPVLALVAQVEMPDAQLFVAMDRENRERQDLSPIEQGRMYAQALEEKLFPSARQMADSLGVSNAWISKTMSVATLPLPVIEAFASPLDIQPVHAKEIHLAIEKDQRAVLKRAEKLRGQGLKAAAVAEHLVNGPRSQSPKVVLAVEGRKLGSLRRDLDGSVTIQLTSSAMEESIDAVVEAVGKALREGVKR